MTPPGSDAGPDAVFAEVLKQRPFVRRFAARCGVRSASLDDFAQDVVLTAWLALTAGRFNPPDPDRPLGESVRAWLAGIVKNKANDYRRANRRRDRLLLVEADIGAGAAHAVTGQLNPEDVALFRETVALLERVKLPPLSRAVVLLAARGHTLVEIAERLAIPAETAWTCLRRARIAYRKAMRRG